MPDGLAAPAIVVIAVWLAGVLMGWPVLFLIWLGRRAGGHGAALHQPSPAANPRR